MKVLLRNSYNRIYEFVMDALAWFHWKWLRKLIWGKTNNLTEEDFVKIKKALKDHNRIILTEDRGHLSSWAVKLGHFMLTGEWCTYTHVFCNVEKKSDKEFKFIEAINSGVTDKSTFEQVFAADSVCILKVLDYTDEEFDKTVDALADDIGKKYDKRFKFDDGTEMSCVEVLLERLKALPYYDDKMRTFKYMMQSEGNLTPEMYRDCPDFKVELEIRDERRIKSSSGRIENRHRIYKTIFRRA